jgi:hypothetical protein
MNILTGQLLDGEKGALVHWGGFDFSDSRAKGDVSLRVPFVLASPSEQCETASTVLVGLSQPLFYEATGLIDNAPQMVYVVSSLNL